MLLLRSSDLNREQKQSGAGDAAQSAEFLPGMPEAHVNQVWWCMPIIPAFGKWEQKDQKVIVKYLMNSNPALL